MEGPLRVGPGDSGQNGGETDGENLERGADDGPVWEVRVRVSASALAATRVYVCVRACARACEEEHLEEGAN